VFILADDLGWKDVGFMGSEFYETPNIDKLASQGIVFTNAYSNGPNCAPTRASLLSGQYSPRHGVYTVGSAERGQAKHRKLIPTKNRTTLDAGIVTLAEALKPAGYVSASMGKWHMGNDPELGPVGQGFDLNVGGWEAGHPKSYFSPYRNPKLEDGPKGEHLTDRLTEEALGFIEMNRDRPFFLYLPYYAVHTPLQAKKKLIAKYKRKAPSQGQGNATYAAMVESLDAGVGRIMGKLDELGLAENTLVVFSSDNGGVRTITSMEPLRGGKGMLYEGGIRVPLIVRWLAVVKPGRRCAEPVISIDFYPTLLEVTEAAKPPGQILDGQSIVPVLTGSDTLPSRALYWHFPAYLQGKAPGARDEYFRTRPAGAVRQGHWKLIEYFEDGKLELYDLRNDIGEAHNLADERLEKLAELHELLVAWRRALGAPVPRQRNPRYEGPSGRL
jgi:arylsulfatase A-like enzyme